MNYLFVCDWDYTLLWKEFATILKDRRDVNASALVVGRIFYQNLLKESHPFSSVYLLQDAIERLSDYIEGVEERLNIIEKKYFEQNLWRFVWAD